MRRSSVGPSKNAPASVDGEEPGTADARKLAAARVAPHLVSGPDAAEDARRARWTAAGTGVLLTLAGLAAAVLRTTGTAPALVPAAYACGASVCAVAGVLGARGRTRRALWLLVAGAMVMALGDQFD
ncbi:hypothetical protein ABZT03_24055 [Streptomyces sp. NPDC005574]|uniref:hypothetical protein n=1 Tax=Streptomyces sp. NPDC005574 TaxID=3156891 RepID=UPI0033A43228